jgi:Holliday junction resolvase-like predicted endonuclease
MDIADQAAAAHRGRRAILALKPPDFAGHQMAFDVVLVAPWRLPHHIADAFQI